MRNLKTLQMSGNPIIFPPKEVIKGGLQSIMKFLGKKIKNRDAVQTQTDAKNVPSHFETPKLSLLENSENSKTSTKSQTLEKDQSIIKTSTLSSDPKTLQLDVNDAEKKAQNQDPPKANSSSLSHGICYCSNPDLIFNDNLERLSDGPEKENESLFSGGRSENEFLDLQKIYSKRYKQTLRDGQRTNPETGTTRKTSLHLILQHPEEDKTCMRCKRKYLKRSEHELSIEVSFFN